MSLVWVGAVTQTNAENASVSGNETPGVEDARFESASERTASSGLTAGADASTNAENKGVARTRLRFLSFYRAA